MTLTFDAILRSAGIDPAEAQAIRHAFVREHEDTGLPGIHADSTDEEILAYTSEQSAKPRVFPASPPRLWEVFIRESGDQARLWSVLENRGEVSNDGVLRTFDLVETEHLADLRGRLVIGWRPRGPGDSTALRPPATRSWRSRTRSRSSSPASIAWSSTALSSWP